MSGGIGDMIPDHITNYFAHHMTKQSAKVAPKGNYIIIEGMPHRISRRIFDSMGYHKYGKGSLGMGGYEGFNRATRLYYHASWLVEHV
jgi:hypothetical protein